MPSAAEPDFWRGSNGKWGHEVNSCDSESCVRVGRTRLGSVSCSACRERGRQWSEYHTLSVALHGAGVVLHAVATCSYCTLACA